MQYRFKNCRVGDGGKGAMAAPLFQNRTLAIEHFLEIWRYVIL